MPNQTYFDFDDRPQLPPAQPVTTSIDAARRVAEQTPSMRTAVWLFIAQQGDQGATRQEIADRLTYHGRDGKPRQMLLQSVCGRCAELLAARLIFESDEQRDARKVLRICPRRSHDHFTRQLANKKTQPAQDLGNS